MTNKQQQVAGADKTSEVKKGPGNKDEDNCRCKEVSQKTFPQMLKLMVSDLVFWKKTKDSK